MFATAAPFAPEFTTPEARAQLVAQMTVPAGRLPRPARASPSPSTRSVASCRGGSATSCRSCSACGRSSPCPGRSPARRPGAASTSWPRPRISRRAIASRRSLGHVAALAVAMLIAAVLIWLAGRRLRVLPGDEIAPAPAFGFAILTACSCSRAVRSHSPLAPVRRTDPGRRRRPGRAVRGTSSTRTDPVVRDRCPGAAVVVRLDGRPSTDGRRHRLAAVGAPGRRHRRACWPRRRGFERRDIGRHGALAGSACRRCRPGSAARSRASSPTGPVGHRLRARHRRLRARSSPSRPRTSPTVINQIPEIQRSSNALYPDIDLTSRPGPAARVLRLRDAAHRARRRRPSVAAGRRTRPEGRLDFVLSAPISRARWLVRAASALRGHRHPDGGPAIAVAASVLAVGGASATSSPGTAILGLAAAAFAGVGLAAGGLRPVIRRRAGHRDRGARHVRARPHRGGARPARRDPGSVAVSRTSASRWPACSTRSASSPRSCWRSAVCIGAWGHAPGHRPLGPLPRDSDPQDRDVGR